MKTDSRSLFEQQGWIQNDSYTPDGLLALAELIEKLPPVHKAHYGPLFVPLLSRAVPVALELIVVRDGQVLLINRKDEYYDGYHTPGAHMGPGEEWQDTAERIAQAELGCSVVVEKYLASFNLTDNPRFHNVSILMLCRLMGEPNQGEWFTKQPDQMLTLQQKFWPIIKSCL